MKGKKLMATSIIIAIAAALCVFSTLWIRAQREKMQEEERLLSYSVLYKDAGGGKLDLSVLVEPDSPKEDVMRLARHLRQKYDRYSHIFINIYDSEELWRKHRDETFSSEELYRHWLVHIVCDKVAGYDEMQWMQEK